MIKIKAGLRLLGRRGLERGGLNCRKTINWWFPLGDSANLFAGWAYIVRCIYTVHAIQTHTYTMRRHDNRCRLGVKQRSRQRRTECGGTVAVLCCGLKGFRRRRIALWPAYSLCDSLSPRTIIIYHWHALKRLSPLVQTHTADCSITHSGVIILLKVTFEGWCRRPFGIVKIILRRRSSRNVRYHWKRQHSMYTVDFHLSVSLSD